MTALTPPFPADQNSDSPTLSPAPSVLSNNDLLLWSALPDLTLNIAQTAALCGVSVRQLGYWTKQGYVTATGRGARRLYGPEALRRILSICRYMHGGLSLRQSLRAVEEASPVAPPMFPTGPVPLPAAAPPAPSSASAPETVADDLLSLFESNAGTRDCVAGLAAKIGRAVDDVRDIAEQLALRGTLTRTLAGGEIIYARTGGERL